MFYPLAKLNELHEGYFKAFQIKGLNLLLIESEGQRYIIEDRCPHMDAKLSTGKVIARDITCRAHGISFCMATGKAHGPLADTLDCLQRFPLAYDGNRVGIEL